MGEWVNKDRGPKLIIGEKAASKDEAREPAGSVRFGEFRKLAK